MKAKRRRHQPEFKTRVVLDALRGIQSVQQIAKDFEIHPMQVSKWENAMIEGTTSVFEPSRENAASENFERQRDVLHARIGQLTVEVDFLRKKSKQLGL